MNTEQLEARIKVLEEKVSILEDIETIKKLQRAYGYYLQYCMADELVDLFSDSPEVTLRIAGGLFKGKEGVRRFLSQQNPSKNPEFLHQVMQISGIVDVAEDKKTAFGRWYGFGANAIPVKDGVSQNWMNGVYECEYVKEDSKWKFKHIHWCLIFFAPFKEGWVDPSRQLKNPLPHIYRPNSSLAPDGPPEKTTYPSGYVCPFHFKNPVTEK
jgi:hypothetical protein